jgi:hypothetical protein
MNIEDSHEISSFSSIVSLGDTFIGGMALTGGSVMRKFIESNFPTVLLVSYPEDRLNKLHCGTAVSGANERE